MGNSDSTVRTFYETPIDTKHKKDGKKKRSSSTAREHHHHNHQQHGGRGRSNSPPLHSTNHNHIIAEASPSADHHHHVNNNNNNNNSNSRHARQQRRSASMLVHNPSAAAAMHAQQQQQQHQRHPQPHNVIANIIPHTNNDTNNASSTTSHGLRPARRSHSSLTTRGEYSLQQRLEQQRARPPVDATTVGGASRMHWDMWQSAHPHTATTTAAAGGAAPPRPTYATTPAELLAQPQEQRQDARSGADTEEDVEPPPTLEGYTIENRVKPRQRPRHGTSRVEAAPHTVLTIHWDRLDPAQLPEAAPPPPSPREAARLAAAAARVNSPEFYGRAQYNAPRSSGSASPAYINMNASLRGSPSTGKGNGSFVAALYSGSHAASSVASYSVGSRSPSRKRQPLPQPQPVAGLPHRRRAGPRKGAEEEDVHFDDDDEIEEDEEEDEDEEWGRPGSPSGWGSRQHTPAESEEDGEEEYDLEDDDNVNDEDGEELERRRRKHLEDLKERRRKKHSRKGNVNDQDALSSTSDDFEDD